MGGFVGSRVVRVVCTVLAAPRSVLEFVLGRGTAGGGRGEGRRVCDGGGGGGSVLFSTCPSLVGYTSLPCLPNTAVVWRPVVL
ncbi:hypothetical protein BGX38DRAFT_1204574 [Terfezia claveryi]|nr:hypothetical protein BGX38DRAFT_1204574 [Terfezia claveryi]